MKQYYIQLPFTGYFNVAINAESEEEAINEALNLQIELDISNELPQEPEISEWSVHKQIVSGNVFYGIKNEISVEEDELED